MSDLVLKMRVLRKIPRNIEGFVDATLDTTQNFGKPLSETRLWDLHNSLFKQALVVKSLFTIS
jgi:hypothetical protein